MLTCFPLFPFFFLYSLKVRFSALCKKVSQRVKEVKILGGSEKEQFLDNSSRGAGFQHLEDYIKARTLRFFPFLLWTKAYTGPFMFLGNIASKKL